MDGEDIQGDKIYINTNKTKDKDDKVNFSYFYKKNRFIKIICYNLIISCV